MFNLKLPPIHSLGIYRKEYTKENTFHNTVAFNTSYCKKICKLPTTVSPVAILRQTEQKQNKIPLELDTAHYLKTRLVGDAYLTSIMPMAYLTK